MDEVILAGILAIGVFIVTLFVSIKRSSDIPTYETREAQLSKRISDLEVHIKKQDIVIERLQEMLYEKQAKVEELTERVRQLEQASGETKVVTKRKPNLVLAVGTDKMLQIDIARLRGIKKLQLSVIEEASMADVEQLLRQRRFDSRPVKLMQISTHSGPNGVQFSDGLADGVWLSEHLKDVEILVLAGCQNHGVASLLTMVPFVVSVRDRIENEDASTFSFHFWFAIGEDREPEDAYYYALEKSNHRVSEMAEYHLHI